MTARYRKALAALLGSGAPAVYYAVLDLIGTHIDPAVATGICTVLATAATALVPANAPKPPSVTPVPPGTTTGGTTP